MSQSPAERSTSSTSHKSVAKAGVRIIRIVLLAYLGFCLLLMIMESRLIYLPPPPSDSRSEAQELGAEEVWLRSEDQTKLHGWYFPKSGSTRALIYFHGNGEDADQNLELGAYLRECLNAAVLVFDYRGYGHSEGSPSEEGIISDAIATQQWLAEKTDLNPSEMILFGRSLGGGVAVAAAEKLGAKALILHSTFANMDDIAASQYPFVPVRLLMRNPFRSQQRIKQYGGPVLQFHGTADELIPIEFARPLIAAVTNENKKFIELPNGHHNDPLTADFCEVVSNFLTTIDAENRD
ncbi:alpha/beta hydrolase [Bythopirellula polymerisocia]|uniref:Alpha/beta hydrolase family protein n=1 Tax=Bythopirellula polymerisocia TaxID=2528003 RepID=A0A5C6CEL7_9BACT|nr:alpha/beta hydrolase [Bythopirellula polymerisocia]TWU21954.1 Alpha/beta hydrolase family protein [Bythopirellula polymerisocia]